MHENNIKAKKWATWITIITIPCLLILWLSYPIKFYTGYAPTYLGILISENEKTTFVGVVKVEQYKSTWDAKNNFKLNSGKNWVTSNIETWEGRWLVDPKSGDLDKFFMLHKNLVWSISPSKKIGPHSNANPQWQKTVEELAKLTRMQFLNQVLKSNQLKEVSKTRFEMLDW